MECNCCAHICLGDLSRQGETAPCFLQTCQCTFNGSHDCSAQENQQTFSIDCNVRQWSYSSALGCSLQRRPQPIVFLRLTLSPFVSSSLKPTDFPPSQLNLLCFSSRPPASYFQPWHSSLHSLGKSKLSQSSRSGFLKYQTRTLALMNSFLNKSPTLQYLLAANPPPSWTEIHTYMLCSTNAHNISAGLAADYVGHLVAPKFNEELIQSTGKYAWLSRLWLLLNHLLGWLHIFSWDVAIERNDNCETQELNTSVKM